MSDASDMSSPSTTKRKVLLIGWDAADWKVINPLLEQGKMPALQRLIDSGVSGNIATLHPVLSPMLWTSIATGKRAYKHGIHGFTEPLTDGTGIAPVSCLSRKTKAVWNILNQSGLTPNVVGWWPSYPAEPIRGVMVSNNYQRAPKDSLEPQTTTPIKWPMLPGTIHPARLTRELSEFRFHPNELTGEQILPFVPKLAEIDQRIDTRVVGLASVLAETVSVQGAATALMQLEPWDFMSVYFDGIDHFSHLFMKYHPPRQEWIPERDFELYSGAIEAAYRFHDMILGTLVALAGPETTVMLLSDHGFHPDHLRPSRIPLEPAGPAVEHREYGIFCMSGPGIKKAERVHAVSLLDICPTILQLYGLPVGVDMDGKVVSGAFEQPPEIEFIPSWDEVEGETGMHPEGMRTDPVTDAAAMDQLVALGYIDDPGKDTENTITNTVRELRYNLAVSYIDASLYAPALAILEELWIGWPDEHRFGLKVIECTGSLRDLARRREAIDQITESFKKVGLAAAEELEHLKPELEQYRVEPAGADNNAGFDVQRMPRELINKFNQFQEQAIPRQGLLRWLNLSQAILEGDRESSRQMLGQMEKNTPKNPSACVQIANSWLQIGDPEKAKAWYEHALEADPENANAFAGLARVSYRDKDWDTAIDMALSTLELSFYRPAVHLLLARALMRRGESEAAEKAIQVALSQAPRNAKAHRLMAVLCTRHLDQPARASKHRRSAREIVRDRMFRRHADSTEQLDRALEMRSMPSSKTTPFEGVPKDQIITVVSGLPRSGTSMMMRMLELGGMHIYTDHARSPDEYNSLGYYEHEQVKGMVSDSSWMDLAKNKVIKIVSSLIPHLPAGMHYCVISMERDPKVVMQSQSKMISKIHPKRTTLQPSNDALLVSMMRQLIKADHVMATRPDIRVLYVGYEETLDNPATTAAAIQEYLGSSFDPARASSAVDQSMQHFGSRRNS